MIFNSKLHILGLLIFLVLTGCVSYNYKGESAPPKEGEIPIFTDGAKIKDKYTTLGEAVVSGDYQTISRDRLINKLISEARKNGADAILLVDQQVIPDNEYRSSPRFTSAYDFDDTNNSWNQLNRDMDLNFGSIRNKKNSAGNGTHLYKRIISAKFIRYTK